MKIIVGVDAESKAQDCLALLKRLYFPSAEFELVNVVDTTALAFSYELVPSASEAVLYADAVRKAGRSTLEHLHAYCQSEGLPVTLEQLSGPIASTLIDHAEQSGADLIAVQANLHGPFKSLIYGSVGKALTIGSNMSVLISKRHEPAGAGIKAVFATDFSPYCEKMFDQFCANLPKGLEELMVVTAYLVQSDDERYVGSRLNSVGLSLEDWVRERLSEKAQRWLEALRNKGVKCSFRLMAGHPNECIEQAMHDTGADILVLGAQGHGFLERVMIGSISLHQVVNEPYSVLILRG